MELKELFQKRITGFTRALESFEDLLNVDLSELKQQLDDRLIDGIRNGQIQKFEYCSELAWKLIKRFLYLIHGIDSKTPKGSIKELYRIGYSNEETYRSLINMINDRNMLSHIYNEEEFNKIYNKLPEYLKAMKTVQNYIEQEALENL